MLTVNIFIITRPGRSAEKDRPDRVWPMKKNMHCVNIRACCRSRL